MTKLQAARASLARMPKPADWDMMKDDDGKVLNIKWPVNLNVLDDFIRCWGRPYRDAYGCQHQTP
jgi:hypothetical protein